MLSVAALSAALSAAALLSSLVVDAALLALAICHTGVKTHRQICAHRYQRVLGPLAQLRDDESSA